MTHGKFVWHDLMTTDPAKARDFYTKLFGWTAVDFPMADGTFTMFQAGERKVGGMVGMDPKGGIPPHWMPYVSVPKLDDAVERAKTLGAKVVAGPMQAEGVGRWAVIADPQGGYISPFETAPSMSGPPADEMMPPVGAFCWEELNSTDVEGSIRFYTSLFGWRAETMKMEPMGHYTMVYAGKEGLGGMMPVQGPPMTYWLSYLHVADVDASAKRVTELGGQLCFGPQDIPNIGRFAVVADPTGAAFALYKSVHV